ncbi:hypothetical protein Gogos_003452, partial [Gossypium gossypioides]|nr:hypothetical protein [Gossypium gossypioides]
MKAIGRVEDDSRYTDVMVPMAHSQRSPVFLLMGGGMGAGKSTVLKDIKESFWGGAAANAVVVEADAFKETDVIYRALASRGHHHDMLQTAELTIAMARNVHKHQYRMGDGYKADEDGTIIENYWEQVQEQQNAVQT